jgi:Phosphotransferase enzyme family
VSGHEIEVRAERVVKRFRAGWREAYDRELRALTLLAEHAPGLTPRPLAARFPTLEMTRLAGSPLRGTVLDPTRTAALAEAVRTLQEAVPPAALAALPPRPDTDLGPWLREVTSRLGPDPVGDPLVARALAAGLAWLAGADLTPGPDVTAVFGPGDGNLSNYLWDGERVTVVDFEYSGRSDRAYELAEITEHVSAWVETPLDVPAFLDHFRLTPAETTRLADCRRLLALVWLVLLCGDDPVRPRNPPGSARRQATRLLTRLTDHQDALGMPG